MDSFICIIVCLGIILIPVVAGLVDDPVNGESSLNFTYFGCHNVTAAGFKQNVNWLNIQGDNSQTSLRKCAAECVGTSKQFALWPLEGLQTFASCYCGNLTDDVTPFTDEDCNGVHNELLEVYGDEDECADESVCQQTCVNTLGGYRCECPRGYYLTSDGTTCQDINECTDRDAVCDQQCSNTEGGYTCHCYDGYIPRDNNCLDCQLFYRLHLDVEKGFKSECPTVKEYTGTSLEQCIIRACKQNIHVVNFLNSVCELKQCQGEDIQLSSRRGGWDIYKYNDDIADVNIISTSISKDDGGSSTSSDLPLWVIPSCVAVGAVVLVSIATASAVCCFLKKRSKDGIHGIQMTAVPANVYGSGRQFARRDDTYLQPVDSRQPQRPIVPSCTYDEIPYGTFGGEHDEVKETYLRMPADETPGGVYMDPQVYATNLDANGQSTITYK